MSHHEPSVLFENLRRGITKRLCGLVGLICAASLTSACGGAVDTAVTKESSVTTPKASVQTTLRIAKRRSLVCELPHGARKLPAATRHGLIDHLLEYPDVRLATKGERRGAERVLASLESAARLGHWSDPRYAERAGFDMRTVPRKPGDRSIHYLHAERHQEPRGRILLNPRRPKALIYANAPGRPLALVGAMWSMRRDELGPTPGGPITRWHSHIVCVKPGHRGLVPPASGKCLPGMTLRQGRSEMLHVWFTRQLRSAFAIRAPEPELCKAGLLPRTYCRSL